MSTHPRRRVRVSVAGELGGGINGAWWPRTAVLTTELADLVTTLTTLVGDVTALNVNWPPGAPPPDYNRPGWQYHRPHIVTISGGHNQLRLLVIAHTTRAPLAVTLLRRAAGQPIHPAARTTTIFDTAGAILIAAQRHTTS
ncbi:DUF5994 family protein [Mycolicibacterium fortuitum]|uniref:DUF5994 family protein n=1 Tax=Mycolicibacterium fortuitum TaxID=1766 RepID=UPI0026380316|nr:DUF5994 family protein [Mycolicibacterium fortuitum]